MALSFSLHFETPDLRGIEALATRVWLLRGIRRGVLIVQRRAMLNLTGRFLRVRSNRLRSSVTTEVRSTGAEVLGRIGTNVFYGKLHELGVPGPWVIAARHKKALRFQMGGRLIFARRVTHPGLKERPWLRTALAESAADVELAIEQEFRRAAGRAGGA